MTRIYWRPTHSNFNHLYMFLDAVPPPLGDSVEPPEFDNPASSRECPWTFLDFCGVAMLGALGTAAVLCCIFVQRKYHCCFDAR